MNDYIVMTLDNEIEDIECIGYAPENSRPCIFKTAVTALFIYYTVYADSLEEVIEIYNNYFKSPHQISLNLNYFNDGKSR